MANTDTFKEKLFSEQKRLEDMLGKIGRKTSTPGDWEARPEDLNISRADANERADEMEEYETRIAMDATLEDQLGAVRAALARIDAGTYGACTVCGAAIEEDRLSAHPAANTCKVHM